MIGSFPKLERSLDIILGINRVSIHSKLHLAGMEKRRKTKKQRTQEKR